MTMSRIGRTVLHGQRITAWLHCEKEWAVCGYLAGMDDDHWFILRPEGDELLQFLVQRRPIPVLEIHTECTYDQEPLRREMDKMIVHFRTWLSRNVFKEKRS
jgi:hypothetical protein